LPFSLFTNQPWLLLKLLLRFQERYKRMGQAAGQRRQYVGL
jgi:hypothetical protein